MSKSRPETPLSAKQTSRRLRLERQKRLAHLGAAGVLLIVFGILAYGYWEVNFQEPISPVALVNGVPIRTVDYQSMVRLQRFQLDNLIQLIELQLQSLNPQDPGQADTYLQFQITLANIQAQREQLPTTVLESMIEAELIRQLAEAEGITVSEEEVDNEIRTQFGFGPTPTPSSSPAATTTSVVTASPALASTTSPSPIDTPQATPSVTEDPFETSYRQFLQSLSQVGVSEEFLRKVIRQQLLGQKMKDFVTKDLPESEPQVHARHILVATEEEAQEVLARLEAGEEFVALAVELSLDQETGSLGGDLGWFPKEVHENVFDEVAFSLQPGEISSAVETSLGFEIILVLEKDESRELSPEILDERKEEAFRSWLEDKKSQAVILNLWIPEKVPRE